MSTRLTTAEARAQLNDAVESLLDRIEQIRTATMPTVMTSDPATLYFVAATILDKARETLAEIGAAR